MTAMVSKTVNGQAFRFPVEMLQRFNVLVGNPRKPFTEYEWFYLNDVFGIFRISRRESEDATS